MRSIAMHRFKSALVVDDQKVTAHVIAQVLERLGVADVEVAADGTEALTKLEHRQYSLVISDLRMPAMDGLELVRQIRGSARFGSVPFIMISIDGEPEVVLTAEKAGADAFLAKPFSAPALRQKLALLSEMRRAPAIAEAC
jgi:two-component system chemotaxis response regulator CheY